MSGEPFRTYWISRFTSSAERDNDENLVIVDDAALARAYLEEFQRVYAQAQAPGRCR